MYVQAISLNKLNSITPVNSVNAINTKNTDTQRHTQILNGKTSESKDFELMNFAFCGSFFPTFKNNSIINQNNILLRNLANIKNDDGEKRFNDAEMLCLKFNLNEHPEKFSAIKALAYNKNIDSRVVCHIISQDERTAKNVSELAKIKQIAPAEPKFNDHDLWIFALMNKDELENSRKLATTRLDGKSIAYAAKNLNVDKLVIRINDFEQKLNGSKGEISIDFDYENPENIILKSPISNTKERNIVLDKNLDIVKYFTSAIEE